VNTPTARPATLPHTTPDGGKPTKRIRLVPTRPVVIRAVAARAAAARAVAARPVAAGPAAARSSRTRRNRSSRLLLSAVTVIAAAAGVAALVGLAGPAWAAGPAAPTLNGVIEALRLWLVGILAALATLFLTVGGIRYLTAAGDPAQVERAKVALKSAAIGYALAAMAPLLVAILQSVVGA